MMDMKRVEHLQKWLDGKYVIPKVFKESVYEVTQTIKQQQEALDGLGHLNEYLQSHPELSGNRIGESVGKIAMDALKRQREQIERHEEALKFYADAKTYEVDVLGQWEPRVPIDDDEGDIARQALEQPHESK